MFVTQDQYSNAKEIAKEIQRQPPEVQRAILNMLYGAIAISDMYRGAERPHLSKARPSV